VSQVAVVTGGANGLGEFIVRRLHAGGYRVAVVDIDGPAATALLTSSVPRRGPMPWTCVNAPPWSGC
jgi:3-oxoacyl-[acyl-carrier protein] reductase